MFQKLRVAYQQLFIYMYAPAHVIIGIHLLTQLHIVYHKLIDGLLHIGHTFLQRVVLLFVVL